MILAKFCLLLLLAVAPGPPGVVIDHQSATTRQYIGSPSIAILPNGDYVASHDLFGPGSSEKVSSITRVFRSTNRGQTWQRTAELHDQSWSNLFVHRGALYILGTSFEYGRIVLRRSTDSGRTWQGPFFLSEGTGFHTSAVPIIEVKGRLWRAFEFHPTGPWGSFEAFLLSVPSGADLTDPKNWTMTERLAFPASATDPHTWLEGNAVLTPDGQIVDILRVHNTENVATLRLKDGALHFDGTLAAFPGGAKKFVIRFDPKTKRYWTLSNPAPAGVKDPASIRNTLALLSSKDLREWKLERVVLQHPDSAKHAFQYPDWQFDGKDMVAAVRTAADDEDGGAPRGHDANFLTFHRILNFRKP